MLEKQGTAMTTTAAVVLGIPGAAWRDFVSYLDASEQTVRTYARALKPLQAYLSDNGISTPKKSDIVAYKRHLETQGKSPATISLYMAAARLFFRWLSASGIYPDIADHIKGGRIDKAHPKRDALTAAQVRAVLEAIDIESETGARDYAIILLMSVCGLRDIEVSRAKISDLRNAGGNAILQVFGKGRGDAADIVILPERVENAIRKSIVYRLCSRPEEPLFISMSNRNAGNRLTTRSISRLIKARFSASGLDSPRLTAHSLRHTAITLALLGGNGTQQVQAFARHAAITTTMVYAHNINEIRVKTACSASVEKAIFTNSNKQ